MPIITRRIRTLSSDDFFARSLAFYSRETLSSETRTFRWFPRQSVSALLEWERKIVAFIRNRAGFPVLLRD